MNTLRFKLINALLVGTIITVTVVGLLVRRATAREFAQFVQRDSAQRTTLLRARLEEYYQRMGSWQGVEHALVSLSLVPRGAGTRASRLLPILLLPETRLILTDAEWRILWDSREPSAGAVLGHRERDLGIPLVVEDATVGYLLTLTPAIGRWNRLQQEYLQRMDGALVRAGIITGLVGILFGIVFAQQLTAPLRALTTAVRRIARGDFTQRVTLTAQDEVGELGTAFNQMAAALAEQEKWRKQLMSDIAHELRTPISVIQGQLEALLDGVFPLDAEQIAAVHDETLLLAHLVDDLRDLAWAEAGQIELHRAPTDVIALTETVVNNFCPQATERGITLTPTSPASLYLLNIDAARIRQVLGNLISNALRHTPRGGTIEVHVRAKEGAVQLCVTDTGPGITAEDLPHIFDRFYKGDKARGGGAGLGLAIARQWVRAHGGRIWAENRTSGGARFCFTIPARGKR